MKKGNWRKTISLLNNFIFEHGQVLDMHENKIEIYMCYSQILNPTNKVTQSRSSNNTNHRQTDQHKVFDLSTF